MSSSSPLLGRQVLVGNMQLTRLFWEETSQPLHAALLGAYVQCVLSQHAIGPTKRKLEAQAHAMEAWATGVLDMMPSASVAHRVLRLHAMLHDLPSHFSTYYPPTSF